MTRSNLKRGRGARDRTPWYVKIALVEDGKRTRGWQVSVSSHTTESAARKAVAKVPLRLAEGTLQIPYGWRALDIQVSHAEITDRAKGFYHYENPLLRFDLEGNEQESPNPAGLERARRVEVMR